MTLAIQDVRSAYPEFADPNAYPDTQIAGWIAQIAGLRAAFPEFASADTYPDLLAVYWLGMGNLQLSAARFGSSLSLAIRLYAAHNLVLAAQAAKQVAAGAAVGSGGILSSKSIDGVSASYDTSLTAFQNAGVYNATSYGQRLYGMLRAAGTGPRYVPQVGHPSQGLYGYRVF